jgi:hypothetical protein
VLLALRWVTLEKVLQASATRHGLYLPVKPSHVGFACGRAILLPALSYNLRVSAWSIEFFVRDCSSLLDQTTFLEGATVPTSPYVAIVRLGPRVPGLVLPFLITPHWAVLDSYRLFPGVGDP